MNPGDSDFVSVMAIIGIFIAPITAMIVWRVLAHKERIEMIRHGMAPQKKWHGGTAWERVGPVPPPQPPPMPGPAMPIDFEAPDRSLRKGIMLALVGFAIFIGLSFIGFGNGSYRPGPWLLGGLVPMFVGIAQIIIAVLSGAHLGLPQQPPIQGPYAAGPYAAPPPSGPTAAGPEVRVYGPEPRVHSGYEELKRPAQPPDYR